jgi:hypothetical protein
MNSKAFRKMGKNVSLRDLTLPQEKERGGKYYSEKDAALSSPFANRLH